ncbi:MAG: hypothetical protein EOP88_24500 [Verrucomicrobiaceae bacterium]|nr:MAG: hypothetical protein EOP88_24500 [Verrucomicrobiaceae bacterium]
MRTLPKLLPWLAIISTALSQPAENAGSGPKDVALDNLLSERGPAKAFNEAVTDAQKNGVGPQAILEARFLYHIDRGEDAAIAALLPDFLKQRDVFKIEDTAIFAVKEDWLAVVEFVQAIAALKKDDKAGFKTHITEAFWLSPRQASAFAPHIERLRLEETMRDVKIDFATVFKPLPAGDAVPLGSVMAGKKAMLLHFWSPAAPESEASLPDYAITAKALGENGIAMVSVLVSDEPETLTKSATALRKLGDKPPGAWLVDNREKPLARELRVQELPVFVIVSNEGKVLFNGQPSDDALWDTLRSIDPLITRPSSPKEEE